tara:strand:- start:84 stop:767 length:684 start_codon:yes stop_codon:yes gene_type:complete
MKWDDTGYLISKNRYNENSIISEIYTKSHGKVSGIIFGGTSKKIKNYLQLGNHLFVNYNSKSENKIGYFKIEILNAISPFYFDDEKKLLCITSAINLIKILTAELQSNYKIYELIDNFYKILKTKNWIEKYIFWELELLKILGYDLELNTLAEKRIINGEAQYFVQSSNEKKIIPNFLIERKVTNHENFKDLLSGLNLIGNFLDKNIFKPNNINFPLSRIRFINALR